jgi:hypothetical protein
VVARAADRASGVELATRLRAPGADRGRRDAIHIGRKSELGLTGIQIAPTPSGEDEWRRWLRDNGIDWDGEVA